MVHKTSAQNIWEGKVINMEFKIYITNLNLVVDVRKIIEALYINNIYPKW